MASPKSCFAGLQIRSGRYLGNIVKEDRPGISPEVLLFPPVFLDDYFREKFLGLDRVGQKIPVDPGKFLKMT